MTAGVVVDEGDSSTLSAAGVCGATETVMDEVFEDSSVFALRGSSSILASCNLTIPRGVMPLLPSLPLTSCVSRTLMMESRSPAFSRNKSLSRSAVTARRFTVCAASGTPGLAALARNAEVVSCVG